MEKSSYLRIFCFCLDVVESFWNVLVVDFDAIASNAF